MMAAKPPSTGRRLINGGCGALLGAPSATFVQLEWLSNVNWFVVALGAAVGFALAWQFGEEAVEFLKTVFWWSS